MTSLNGMLIDENKYLSFDIWIKNLWNVGSKAEIYSKSSNTWIVGDIVGIFTDSEGEWLEVKYSINTVQRLRQIPRYDEESIRPLSKAIKIYQYIYKALKPLYINKSNGMHNKTIGDTVENNLNEIKNRMNNSRITDEKLNKTNNNNNDTDEKDEQTLKSSSTDAPKTLYNTHPKSLPKPAKIYWGKSSTTNNENIISFNSSISNTFSSNNQHLISINQYIQLWLQSNQHNRFNHSIKENDDKKTNWKDLSIMKGNGYGINFNDFADLIKYWNNKFNLKQHISKITNFNHFTTIIQGLNIHFIKEKSKQSSVSSKCDAIIALHGWPGSFFEFHKVINLLKNQLNNIDIIVPSLPGYGFSDFPSNYTQFNCVAVASIMKDLMEQRLKYKNYIVIGGDWGAFVAKLMGFLSCNESNSKLLGILTNNALTSRLDLNENSMVKIGSMMPVINGILDFTGYQHIQSTRPNTIGISLESSPIAICSWIYEKYLSWTDGPNKCDKIRYDSSNGRRMISSELNWDDVIMTVCIYWLCGSVTTGINYYAENMRFAYGELNKYYMPENVNIGIVDWNDSIGGGKGNHEYHFRNIVYYKNESKGGHFAALEIPKQYVENVFKFISVLK